MINGLHHNPTWQRTIFSMAAVKTSSTLSVVDPHIMTQLWHVYYAQKQCPLEASSGKSIPPAPLPSQTNPQELESLRYDSQSEQSRPNQSCMLSWSKKVSWGETEEGGLPIKIKTPTGGLVTHIMTASAIITWRKRVKDDWPGEKLLNKRVQ